MEQEKVNKIDTIYQGKILTLKKKYITLPNGEPAEREIIEHLGGVGILAINDNDEFLLISQFRTAINQTLLEIPAGLLEKGENPLEAARRELREETGYDAKEIKRLGEYYPSSGYTNEVIHIYLATDLFYSPLEQDRDEFLTLTYLPIKLALDFITGPNPIDAKTAIAILSYFNK